MDEVTNEDLLALPEGTWVLDARGQALKKFSSGRETTNPNWIAWEGIASFMHTDELEHPVRLLPDVEHA